ncbi:hypothetical protein [Draconibacterium sediminis]|uniref:TonB C-terminal domain-containing protein n=1 Tax=Draconibacterium sediminis TaxID=1544798 RepID=A0A0D8JD68_9BACT|nr:hypothetical protein [Draconibacterium sediminis]KJF43733.1 hypothetical protein LH29_11650 [Draconibacterium sediminis]
MKIGELYRRNVYGVIGTLVFHILLFSAFLLADVDMKGNVKEEEILIEFPAEMLEPEINEPETVEEERTDQPDIEQTNNTRTNVASNRSATENTTTSTDEFFDDDYLKEVEAAQQLVSNVNKNLAKETVDLSDIEMPVETTEGMDRDSIKNVIYAGESNIVYYLENRYHIRLPVPVYLSQGGGTVIVDIVVNREGKVVDAEPRDDNSIRDKQLFAYAKEAAIRTVFNSDNSAPTRQKGTIQYTFVAQ